MSATSHCHVILPRLKRKNVQSGVVSDAEWQASQHWMLCDPDGYPARSLQKVCEDLVAKWNRQQPEHWHYWLESAID